MKIESGVSSHVPPMRTDCIHISINRPAGIELSSKMRQINYKKISAAEKVRTAGRTN